MGEADDLVECIVANVTSQAVFAAILTESVTAAQLNRDVICDGTWASLDLVRVADLAKLGWSLITFWGIYLANADLAESLLE